MRTRDGIESVSLRAWLREGWAVLFSHPLDFVRCDFEMDRWLAVIQGAFSGTRVRPLALATAARSLPPAGSQRSAAIYAARC